MNEDGYIHFDEPVTIDIGNGPQEVKIIDLRIELWGAYADKKPSITGVSLLTKNGWINAPSTNPKLNMRFYQGEKELTPEPKFPPFEDWQKVADIIGSDNKMRTTSVPAIHWNADMWKQKVG